MKLLPYEIWRDIPGFEGYYQVSSNNGFRSLKHRNIKLSFVRSKHKYRTVNIYKDGGDHYQYQYHILVAKAFPEICGEWFEGCNVHHIDFNRFNNVPSNLIVLSAEEHQQLHYKYLPDSFKKPSDKRSKSIRKALTGKRYPERDIPILQLTRDGELIKEWGSLTEAAITLGYRIGNICSVCRGKLKTAYNYIWRYK